MFRRTHAIPPRISGQLGNALDTEQVGIEGVVATLFPQELILSTRTALNYGVHDIDLQTLVGGKCCGFTITAMRVGTSAGTTGPRSNVHVSVNNGGFRSLPYRNMVAVGAAFCMVFDLNIRSAIVNRLQVRIEAPTAPLTDTDVRLQLLGYE
jgi:hypothetical protein